MPEPYAAILFIHVASALVLAGGTVYAPLARGLVLRARSLAELRQSVEFSRRAAKWNPLSAFVLLGSGMYLGSWGWWAQPWFYVAIVAWVADTALAVAVIDRSESIMLRVVDRAVDGLITQEVDALRKSPLWAVALAAMIANDLAVLYLMFVKPALVASVSAVIVSNIVALAIVIVRRRMVASRVLERPVAPV